MTGLTQTVTDPTRVVLDVSNLTTTFHGANEDREIVRGISFTLFAGRTLVLLGESGSGKSVTARSILRLYGRKTTFTGSALLAGRSLMDLDEAKLGRMRGTVMALVPQDPNSSLDPIRRVRAQLRDAIEAEAGRRVRGADLQERVERALSMVGIHDVARVAQSYPHELSGGMRQRVAIALAVIRKPQLLIADEPTTALDPTVQRQVLDVLLDLQKNLGTAMLFVTHDVDVARAVADDIAVMYKGQFVEYGPASEVLDNPLHVYTKALLGAVPHRNSVRGQLQTVAMAMAGDPQGTDERGI